MEGICHWGGQMESDSAQGLEEVSVNSLGVSGMAISVCPKPYAAFAKGSTGVSRDEV